MFNDRTEPLGLFGAKSQIAMVVQPSRPTDDRSEKQKDHRESEMRCISMSRPKIYCSERVSFVFPAE
jgi:hypothetical protein